MALLARGAPYRRRLTFGTGKPQGGGGGVIRHHAVNGRFAVAAVFGAVGGVDVRAQVGLVVADVFDGDIGLQACDSDASSSRAHRVAEPAVVAPVPGPHVDVPARADNPDRNIPAQCPVGALGRDPELFCSLDPLQLIRRPRDGHNADLLAWPGSSWSRNSRARAIRDVSSI